MGHQPITPRFTQYSEEDRAADELWASYQRREDHQTHGYSHLHEQPPHVQKIVYDLSHLLRLGAVGVVGKVSDLPHGARPR